MLGDRAVSRDALSSRKPQAFCCRRRLHGPGAFIGWFAMPLP